jgi:uncharacterized protein with GYD domain
VPSDVRLQGGLHRVNSERVDLLVECRIAPFEGAVAVEKGESMATYITLGRYTQQGMSKIKESPSRLEALRGATQKAGGATKGFYLTMGRYDFVLMTEAPSDDVIARLTLATGALGNVTTETLRAFTEDEFKKLVSSLP